MRVLITGGAGFIGSHLTEALLSRGDEVLIMDDLSTGSSENIRHLKNIPKLNYWIDSVMNKALLAELVDESDIVVHLAAAVGVRLIVESPVRTIETNIKGTELVLEAARKKKKKVFIASTSEVYGKSAHFPFREEDDLVLGSTDKGRWSYAASKALDEFLALAYWKERKLPVVVGRFFNTIGPRQTGQYGMVVPNFVRQALEGRPITVFGTGKQSRCFCYVGDTVAAILKLLDAPESVGQVFNIGSSEEISIEGLAKLIKAKLSSSSPISYIPYDQAYEAGFEDMPRRIPSTAKIERCIGWRPSTSLDSTIDLIAEHFRQRQKPSSTTETFDAARRQLENTDAAA
ncbi:MAG: GDP-mannose 4,6-dehydratase [Acidobacteria bacterium]|nr:GDP-mannose 4,6-dehydratase [Acidobacteriota bacterium]